jgi:hypothetical protein
MDEFDEIFGSLDEANNEKQSKRSAKIRQISIAAFWAMLVGAGIAITTSPSLKLQSQRASALEDQREADLDLQNRSAQIAKRIAHDELMFDLQRGGDPYALRDEYRMKIEAIDRQYKQR